MCICVCWGLYTARLFYIFILLTSKLNYFDYLTWMYYCLSNPTFNQFRDLIRSCESILHVPQVRRYDGWRNKYLWWLGMRSTMHRYSCPTSRWVTVEKISCPCTRNVFRPQVHCRFLLGLWQFGPGLSVVWSDDPSVEMNVTI